MKGEKRILKIVYHKVLVRLCIVRSGFKPCTTDVTKNIKFVFEIIFYKEFIIIFIKNL